MSLRLWLARKIAGPQHVVVPRGEVEKVHQLCGGLLASLDLMSDEIFAAEVRAIVKSVNSLEE